MLTYVHVNRLLSFSFLFPSCCFSRRAARTRCVRRGHARQPAGPSPWAGKHSFYLIGRVERFGQVTERARRITASLTYSSSDLSFRRVRVSSVRCRKFFQDCSPGCSTMHKINRERRSRENLEDILVEIIKLRKISIEMKN